MDIARLTSELREVPSYSHPVKELFEADQVIPEIITIGDIDTLLDLAASCDTVLKALVSNPVSIDTIRIHAKIVKPFISDSDLEDYFV
jgi:hypothetical protein